MKDSESLSAQASTSVPKTRSAPNSQFSTLNSQLVLLVEDNEQLNEINRRALTQEGYTVLTALTLGEARAHLAKTAPDVILLDVLLPDGNGIDFCAELRNPNSQFSILNSQSSPVHILFLTSKQDQEDRIRGLNTGGDDYITKPYKLEEMLSRVRAAMRRRGMDSAKPVEPTVTCGALMLDTLASRAFWAGKDLLLTQKEFALLLVLVYNKGKAVSKESLYEAAWKAPLSEDAGALWRHISSLKKKLGEKSDRPLLTASRGEGYTLEIPN